MDLAELRAIIIADESIIGVSELELGHRRVKALNQGHARLRKSRDRHERRALRDFPATFEVRFARIIKNTTDCDPRCADIVRISVGRKAVQTCRIWCRVRRDR